MTPTNPERSERTRRAILDAARPVFARHGFAAASLNRIIDDSGMTKGAFYFHFQSKQALALAVMRDQQRDLLQRVSAEVLDLPTAVERLFETPRVIVAEIEGGRGPTELSRMIGELAQDPVLCSEVNQALRAWVDLVADQFRAAQAEGAVRDDVDAKVLAEVAVGGLMGIQQLTEQLADDRLARRAEALIEVVRTATRADPAAKRRRRSR